MRSDAVRRNERGARGGLLIVLVLAWGLLGMGSRPPLVGGPAPPFSLNDIEGRPVSLADYRGKVVLLNFWATWCEPCKKEMPEMQAAYESLKERGFAVLAVNFGEKPDRAVSFAHHGGMSFPILLDPRVKVAELYGVVSLPVSFFVDRNGFIQERVFGGTLTEKGIETVVQKLQKEP